MINLINQMFKFGLVGVICFIIDYSLMLLLTEVANASYLLSCGISFSISVVVNYLLSMRFVFKARKSIRKSSEFIIFVVLSVIGLGLTELLMLVAVDGLVIHYMISKIIVTVIVMAYNFVTRKIFLENKEND